MPHSWVEIDLDALRANLLAIQGQLKPWVEVIAMVKANAYGHGAVEVSRTLLEAGASRLGVAFASEAFALREAGIQAPVLLLGALDAEDIEPAVAAGITPSIHDYQTAKAIAAAGIRRGKPVSVHIDVDTGMSRLGVRWDQAPFFVENISRMDGVVIEGIYTHLSSAEEPDQTFTRQQVRRFQTTLDRLRDRGIMIPYRHIQNSAGALGPLKLDVQAVRPGLSLYGLYPAARPTPSVMLRPVMSFYSKVVLIKRVPADTFVSYDRTYRTRQDRLLATLSVGYADGYPRSLSNKGRVLIGGRAFPVAGRITMDHIVVDLGDDSSVEVGDRATLIGTDGALSIGADEVAAGADTISYEITTGITQRVPRVFIHSSQQQQPGTAPAPGRRAAGQ